MPFTYDYPRPALTVDAVIFRKINQELEVLLIQRKNYPFEGMWALPGGFVDMDETVEDAVVRELYEETGLKIEKLEQLHTFSALGRDPRGRTVSVTFFGIIGGQSSQVQGGDDAMDAKWFKMNQIPHLAFDHIEAVNMALKQIN
ncbi:MAG: NUDIX hydrolase [Bacteroidetes bacterium]|nr:NUDIX hydrolase [Bacteroidota bacterium]